MKIARYRIFRGLLFPLLGFLGLHGSAAASGPDMYFDAPADKRMALATAAGDTRTIVELFSSGSVKPLTTGRKATSWIEIAILADQPRAFTTLVAWGALGPPRGKIAGQALYVATIKTSVAWLDRLHAAGADLDNYGGGELLIATAMFTRNAATLDFYIRNGADLDMRTMSGGSIALVAADLDRFDISLRLLALGASPWVMDSYGTTLGYIAEQTGLSRSWDRKSRSERDRVALLEHLHRLGFPQPAPTPDEGHGLRQKRQWPPKAAITP